MIVPILSSLKIFKGLFLTWLICGSLVIFHFVFSLQQRSAPQWNQDFLATTGEFYQLWKGTPPASIQTQTVALQNQAVKAIFDPQFRAQYSKIQTKVDPVRYESWKIQFERESQERDESLIGRVGMLAHGEISLLRLISYSFFHLNFFHLFSNLVFLFVFASVIERRFGSLTLLAVFLVTGIGGGLCYWLTAEVGHPPMIGASASVSGLMSFYLFTERKKMIRYFYFLYPDGKGWGEIALSKYFILPMYFLSDLSSYLSAADSMSGVAFVAHLGGFGAGALLSLFMFAMILAQKSNSQSPPSSSDSVFGGGKPSA